MWSVWIVTPPNRSSCNERAVVPGLALAATNRNRPDSPERVIGPCHHALRNAVSQRKAHKGCRMRGLGAAVREAEGSAGSASGRSCISRQESASRLTCQCLGQDWPCLCRTVICHACCLQESVRSDTRGRLAKEEG